MDTKGLVRDEFNTLREEIKMVRNRAFWILCMGLFGIPILVYLASDTEKPVILLVPFSALALLIAYLTEQNSMMRAARYIREHIETNAENGLGWEDWLESGAGHRALEKHFVACMIVILFIYYCLTIGIALQGFLDDVAGAASMVTWYWLIGMGTTYLVGALWALSILLHHWKTSVSSKVNSE